MQALLNWLAACAAIVSNVRFCNQCIRTIHCSILQHFLAREKIELCGDPPRKMPVERSPPGKFSPLLTISSSAWETHLSRQAGTVAGSRVWEAGKYRKKVPGIGIYELYKIVFGIWDLTILSNSTRFKGR